MSKRNTKIISALMVLLCLFTGAAMAETFVSGAFNTAMAPNALPKQGANGAVHDGVAFVASWSQLWKSEDGATWTQITPTGDVPSFATRPAMTSMGGLLWCMPMGGGVYASEDGQEWYEVVAPGDTPYTLRAHGQALTFDNKIWLIGGSAAASDTADLADVWYSADGVNWTEATDSAAFGMRVWHKVAAFNGKMYVIGGSRDLGDMVPAAEMIYTSTDGVTWTNETPATIFSTRGYFGLAEVNGALVVTGGGDYVGGGAWAARTDTWLTEDGVNWTNCGTPLLNTPALIGFDTMAFGIARRLVTVGGTADFTDWISVAHSTRAKVFEVPNFASRTKVYVDPSWTTNTGTGTSWDDPIQGADWLERAVNITTATADGGVILVKSALFQHARGTFTIEGDDFSDGKQYAIVGGLDANLSGTAVMFKGDTTLTFDLAGEPSYRFLTAKLYKTETVAPASGPVLGCYNMKFDSPLQAFQLTSRYDTDGSGTGDGWPARFDFAACNFTNGQETIWANEWHGVPSTINLWDCEFKDNVSGQAAPNDGGAAVRLNVDAAELNAAGCLFDGNFASGPGGAISVHNRTGAYTTQSAFTFTDCVITSNSTWTPAQGSPEESKDGGGFFRITDDINASIKFIDSVIINNTTGIRSGGVMRCDLTRDAGAGVWFDGCTVKDNAQLGFTADGDDWQNLGGGVVAGSGYVYMKDSVFEGNYSEDLGLMISGGVSALRGGGLQVENCEFRNNTSGGSGGVFGFFDVVTTNDFITVKDSIFVGNTAGYGGGVFAYAMHTDPSHPEFPNMTFENNIFAYNQALGTEKGNNIFPPDGTVFYIYRLAGDPALGQDYYIDFTNCDFIGNKCPSSIGDYVNTVGGPVNHDIWNAAMNFRFENCLFASNVVNISTGDGFPGSVWGKMGTSQGDIVDHCWFYNTIDTTGAQVDHWYDGGNYVVNPTNCNVADETKPGTDPLLNNLVAPTTGAAVDGTGLVAEDFRQASNSPLMNAGVAPVSTLASADFLGVARPINGAYDIGAFEGLKPEPQFPDAPINTSETAVTGWSLYR